MNRARAKLEYHLAMVERHLTEGEARILRLRSIIKTLEQSGEDSRAIQTTLKQFEELQLLHVEDRLQLQNELKLEDNGPPTPSNYAPSLVPGDLPTRPSESAASLAVEALQQRISAITSEWRSKDAKTPP